MPVGYVEVAGGFGPIRKDEFFEEIENICEKRSKVSPVQTMSSPRMLLP